MSRRLTCANGVSIEVDTNSGNSPTLIDGIDASGNQMCELYCPVGVLQVSRHSNASSSLFVQAITTGGYYESVTSNYLSCNPFTCCSAEFGTMPVPTAVYCDMSMYDVLRVNKHVSRARQSRLQATTRILPRSDRRFGVGYVTKHRNMPHLQSQV